MPPFIAARVYLKPLLPGGSTGTLSVDRLLKMAQRTLLRRVKTRLGVTDFSPAAKRAFAKTVKVEAKGSSLQVVSKHPAFGPLVAGQRKSQMTWLTKATRPIPIRLKNGDLIFRNATPKSMERGSWKHPGRPPSDFVLLAKAEARESLKKRLKAEVRKSVLSAIQGRK